MQSAAMEWKLTAALTAAVALMLYDPLRRALRRRRRSHWAVVQGEVTRAGIDEVPAEKGGDGRDAYYVLTVRYRFRVSGRDVSYAGEESWRPPQPLQIAWTSVTRKAEIREGLEGLARRIAVGHRVQVRYKPDDPSVNCIDGGVKRLVGG
jgi:hypothetical protein